MWSRVPLDSVLRFIALARTSSNCKRRPILSSERKLYKNYEGKCSVKKITDRESEGACRQEELIGGKPPVVTGTPCSWLSRLGEFRTYDSEVWSWVPRGSDPRMPALARTSRNYKRQTRPLVREGAPFQQTHNCLTVTKIWSWPPDGVLHQDRLADWQSVVT
jgi:hypothetical protein